MARVHFVPAQIRVRFPFFFCVRAGLCLRTLFWEIDRSAERIWREYLRLFVTKGGFSIGHCHLIIA